MGHVQSILKSIFITEWAFTHLVNNFELVKIVFFWSIFDEPSKNTFCESYDFKLYHSEAKNTIIIFKLWSTYFSGQ
jgi:hypothetical protein